MTGAEPPTTVLVVEDESDLRTIYAAALSEQYDVRTAADGRAALDALDETVAVVLLDRRMPGLSGDDVLERIREGEYDCRVAMLTAVEPDVDLIEMPCDDYVVKPVGLDDLRDTVDSLLTLGERGASVHEHVTDSLKLAALESEIDEDDERAGDLAALRRRVRSQSVEIGDLSAELSAEEYQQVVRLIMRSLDGGE
jgi:DNA-binding response OmpR family regulator